MAITSQGRRVQSATVRSIKDWPEILVGVAARQIAGEVATAGERFNNKATFRLGLRYWQSACAPTLGAYHVRRWRWTLAHGST
jgi:hypothetical protein